MRSAGLELTATLLTLVSATTAWAGEIYSQAGVDFFRADSRNALPGAGSPELMRAHEIGITARMDARMVDDRLRFQLRYRGQEPLDGEVQTSTRRLLYQASASYEIIEDHLVVGAGRFMASAPIFLPVDGAWIQGNLPGNFTLQGYGGRRGVTSSRQNLDFERFLVAAGGTAGWRWDPYLQVEVRGGYSEDQARVAVQSDDELRQRFGSGYVDAVVFSRPIDSLRLGAQGAFIQRAAYLVGPTWRELQVQAEAIDLFRAAGWAEYRPWDWLRLQYNFLFQQPASYRLGTVDGAGDVTPAVVDPQFIDNRVRVAWAPWDLGWVRASYRLRLRPERTEHRYNAELEANELGLPGLFAWGRITFDQLVPNAIEASGPDRSRVYWAAALGYRNFGLDIEAGVSFIERMAAPVSGRRIDALAPEEPLVQSDLSPFVLAAQRIVFVRAFYSHRYGFAGVDFERNLEDAEYRFMVQVGGQLEATW